LPARVVSLTGRCYNRIVRQALLLLCAVGAVLALPTSSVGRAADTHVLTPGQTFTTTEEFDKANPLEVTVSGTLTWTNSVGQQCTFDAFYQWGPCIGGARTNRGAALWIGFEKDSNYFPQCACSLYKSDGRTKLSPPYSESHRYTFTTDCSFNSGGCGQVKFFAGVSVQNPADWGGSITITVGGSTPTSVLVRFNVQISGGPNARLNGVKPGPHGVLVKSSFRGSGTATFTKQAKGGLGKVLEASATSGTMIHDNVYADGTKEHFEFGIISRPSLVPATFGTFYATQTHRLLLLLNVRNGGSGDCPQGRLTLATITLLPGPSGFDGPGNEAIFLGIPREFDSGFLSTNACKGHAYAWVGQPSADDAKRVTVRIAVKVPR
jgi:hypothetical protein